jgi:hypothetical protein
MDIGATTDATCRDQQAGIGKSHAGVAGACCTTAGARQ